MRRVSGSNGGGLVLSVLTSGALRQQLIVYRPGTSSDATKEGPTEERANEQLAREVAPWPWQVTKCGRAVNRSMLGIGDEYPPESPISAKIRPSNAQALCLQYKAATSCSAVNR